MLVPCLAYVLWLEGSGRGHWTTPHLWWLFIVGGLVTMIPLWLFAHSARGLPLSTIGLMQYIAPTLQFLVGVLVFRQPVAPVFWVGLVIVWAGCLVYISGRLTGPGTRPGAARSEGLTSVR
ncbi:EamA family transporter [Propionibacteriaceae bacterium G1746]